MQLEYRDPELVERHAAALDRFYRLARENPPTDGIWSPAVEAAAADLNAALSAMNGLDAHADVHRRRAASFRMKIN